jgi:hypothetical protein
LTEFYWAIPRAAKAVLKQPQSRRCAKFENRMARAKRLNGGGSPPLFSGRLQSI